jgi:hypothetical protein
MKGIAHFATGIAVATFFPQVVYGAAQALSFGPLLGGLAGLMPDTLDFKFVRYFERVDDEIDPGCIITATGLPDPQAMAERIAAAMKRAYQRGVSSPEGPVKIRLHTLRLGTDLWRRYSVTFDLANQQVIVAIGPAVTTAQVPYEGSEIPGLRTGRASIGAPIQHTYDAETQIDIFDGPSMAFERDGDAVRVTFLPWHRAWSHSLGMVLLLGALGTLIAPVYGLVMALAALAHIVEDQLGYMGSSLLFPFARKRTPGLGWMRSGGGLPNFLTVWISMAVVFLNLDRFSATPSIPVLPYLLGIIVAPSLFFVLLAAWDRFSAHRQAKQVRHPLTPAMLAAVEALDETSEVDI